MEREAENNLMIGTVRRLANGSGNPGSEPPFLCCAEEQDHVVAVAIHTPPYNLMLTRADRSTLTALVSHIRTVGRQFPGILGHADAVKLFVAAWVCETG